MEHKWIDEANVPGHHTAGARRDVEREQAFGASQYRFPAAPTMTEPPDSTAKPNAPTDRPLPEVIVVFFRR
jgi:hypothetical protein